MDTTTVIVIALGVLLILGVGLIWLKQKGTGTFEGRVGGTEFKITKKERRKPEQPQKAEQLQKDTIRSTQEQPKGANAKQSQENTTDSQQIIR